MILYRRRLIPIVVALAVLVVRPAGGDTSDAPVKEKEMTLKLTSAAFPDKGVIPPEYTCDDRNISPPLAWTGVPEGTKSLALIIEDPDAPDPNAPKMTWTHWILYDIPPSANGLPKGVATKDLPAGTRAGMSDFRKPAYGGPCPPIGRHRYFHKLYALDTVLPDLEHPTRDRMLKSMAGHILASTELMGTYQRTKK